jgi:microcystin degradation protein MlrC
VRVFVARVSHETNTFSTIATDRRRFEARDLRYGGEILEVSNLARFDFSCVRRPIFPLDDL